MPNKKNAGVGITLLVVNQVLDDAKAGAFIQEIEARGDAPL